MNENLITICVVMLFIATGLLMLIELEITNIRKELFRKGGNDKTSTGDTN